MQYEKEQTAHERELSALEKEQALLMASSMCECPEDKVTSKNINLK